MGIDASEISEILKSEIEGLNNEGEISEVGTVLTVGDGIARVYGLNNVQAGEMVEFPGKIKGMALNLEDDNVGVVILVMINQLKREILLKGQIPLLKCPLVKAFWEEWLTD